MSPEIALIGTLSEDQKALMLAYIAGRDREAFEEAYERVKDR